MAISEELKKKLASKYDTELVRKEIELVKLGYRMSLFKITDML